MDYQKQATDFLIKTKTVFKAEYTGHGRHFEDDKETRDIYQITLTREGKKPFVFSFGQSINKSGTATASHVLSQEFTRSGKIFPKYPKDYERRREAPTAYDVLACITKYDSGIFKDFCSEFGYDSDSRKAEKIYFAVQEEYKEVSRLFGDVIDELAKIQ